MKINTENKNLIRDTNNMALLNVNKHALNKEVILRQRKEKEKIIEQNVSRLQEDIVSIKDDLAKILELLNSRGR